jgi:hypothetical protein
VGGGAGAAAGAAAAAAVGVVSGVGSGVGKVTELGSTPISVTFASAVILAGLTPSDTTKALITSARFWARFLTYFPRIPGNFPATPVAIIVTPEPPLATSFWILAFADLDKTEEPGAKIAEIRIVFLDLVTTEAPNGWDLVTTEAPNGIVA